MLEPLMPLMPVRDILWGPHRPRRLCGAHTGREERFQPFQASWKVPGRDILACCAASQVLARRPSIGVVPPVLPQPSSGLENMLATCADVPGIPAQLCTWAVIASSCHTSRPGVQYRPWCAGVAGLEICGGKLRPEGLNRSKIARALHAYQCTKSRNSVQNKNLQSRNSVQN